MRVWLFSTFHKHAHLPCPASDGQSSGKGGAVNLLGGVYDMSDSDEEEGEEESPAKELKVNSGESSAPDIENKASAIEQPESGSNAEQAALSGAEGGMEAEAVEAPVPDEAKRQIVEKMVAFVARNGQAFEDRVREK